MEFTRLTGGGRPFTRRARTPPGGAGGFVAVSSQPVLPRAVGEEDAIGEPMAEPLKRPPPVRQGPSSPSLEAGSGSSHNEALSGERGGIIHRMGTTAPQRGLRGGPRDMGGILSEPRSTGGRFAAPLTNLDPLG